MKEKKILKWCPSTTIRTPTRLIGFLTAITELEGKPNNRQLEEEVHICSIKSKIYTPNNLTILEKEKFMDLDTPFTWPEALAICKRQKYTDLPMRGRQVLSLLKKMNWVTLSTGVLVITPLGKSLLSNRVSQEDCLLQSILTYALNTTLPFVEGLRIMLIVGAKSKTELSWLLPFSCNADALANIRVNNSHYVDTSLAEKEKNTLVDYADNILRWYMSVGLVTLAPNRSYQITPKHRAWVENLSTPETVESRVKKYKGNYGGYDVHSSLYTEAQTAEGKSKIANWFLDPKLHAKSFLTDYFVFYEWCVYRLFQAWNTHTTLNAFTKLTPEGDPISPAPGGAADMHATYGPTRVIIEATTITTTQQVPAEFARIIRHYREFKADIGFFVAPRVHPDMRKVLATEFMLSGVLFICIETEEFKDTDTRNMPKILETLMNNSKTLKLRMLTAAVNNKDVNNKDVQNLWDLECVNPPVLGL